MVLKNKFVIGFSLLWLSTGFIGSAEEKKNAENSVQIIETWRFIQVKSIVPYPPDVSREDDARRLASLAALTQAREALLTCVLSKPTHSKRPLSVAEVPSLELQQEIRTLVNNAPIHKTVFDHKHCTLQLELKKSKLRKILRSN